MKRASYREGVALIALNDNPGELEAEAVASSINTALLADLFGVDTARVAADVIRYRKKNQS